MVTLLACVTVVWLIAKRRPAIALVLSTPFTAWNLLAAQNGFLTASLLGAFLLLIEERPVLAGVCLGFLSYKPQFGILIPVALAASQQWRVIISTVATVAVLVGISVAAWGAGVWTAFPRQLSAQTDLNLLADASSNWGYLQTVYGFVRSLDGGVALAWLVQGSATLGCAIIVWIVWRSRVNYRLKAAILSAAALIATPYAFAYDMAAIVIPASFLARDQLERGLLRGDKAIWIVLFGAPRASLATLGDNVGGPTFGGTPVSLFAIITLFGAILRRMFVIGGRIRKR